MKYPLYNSHDLSRSSKDGNYQFDVFSEFINQLLVGEYLEHETEAGIAKYIQVNGTEGLSPDQGKVLNQIISRYEKRCKICDTLIDLNQVLDNEDNNGLCDPHARLAEKED